MAWPGIGTHGMAWPCMAWYGMAWHGLGLTRMAWHGLAWLKDVSYAIEYEPPKWPCYVCDNALCMRGGIVVNVQFCWL